MAKKPAATSEPQTTQEPSAPAVKVTSKAKFCAVGSKLPFPLLLQLCAATTKRMSGQHGTVEEKIFVQVGDTHTVRGCAYPVGIAPKGFPRRPEMIDEEANGGYAVTKNIPLEFMQQWLEQNKDTDMVKNGCIRMQPDIDSLADDAADFRKLDSGLGALNPDHDEKTGKPLDRRSPRPINAGVSFVKEEPRASA